MEMLVLVAAMLTVFVVGALLLLGKSESGQKWLKVAGFTGLASLAGASNATDAYTSIVTAVDWTAVETDVVTIFAAVMGVVVIIRGGRMLISAAKR